MNSCWDTLGGMLWVMEMGRCWEKKDAKWTSVHTRWIRETERDQMKSMKLAYWM